MIRGSWLWGGSWGGVCTGLWQQQLVAAAVFWYEVKRTGRFCAVEEGGPDAVCASTLDLSEAIWCLSRLCSPSQSSLALRLQLNTQP
jgi:hypothetical protein